MILQFLPLIPFYIGLLYTRGGARSNIFYGRQADVAARTEFISCTQRMDLTPVSTDGQQTRVAAPLLICCFCIISVIRPQGDLGGARREGTPASYLFLVGATNRNEADYTSKIDNFMLPN